MRKVWLLGLLAAFVLVVGPLMYAYAEGDAPRRPGPPAAPGKGERPPEIQLTPDEQGAIQAEVTALHEAVVKLQAKAEEVLKDKDKARRVVMQQIFKEMRAGRPEGAPGGGPGGGHRPEGGGPKPEK
jgi:hypothetical protein